MNSSKGKQPTQRSKQPTKRTAQSTRPSMKAQRASVQPASKRPASRPSVAPAKKKVTPKPAVKAAQGKKSVSSSKWAAATRSSSVPSSTRTSHARKAAPKKNDIWSRIASSRVAIVAIVIVCSLAVVGVFDTAANWGKAYGNVSINGIDVGGMTADEMVDTLKEEYGARVSHAQVTIYANDEAQTRNTQGEAASDDDSVAEQLSVDDSYDLVDSWQVDALSLKASVPYEEAASQALAVGRDDGGIGKRLNLLVSGQDVSLSVSFDDGLVDELASQIDLTVGDPRVDTTVEIVDGEAQVVEGHSGLLVDRDWLTDMISRAMISGDVPDAFVAKASEAQSRITTQQASEMADAINRALAQGVLFSYQGRTWLAGPSVLGEWTSVSVEGEEGNWKLAASVDSSQAISLVVDKVGAEITSEDMVVTFEDSESGVQVRTAGTGNIPEVSTAVDNLQAALFGPEGVAWGADAPSEPVTIEITESDRPETLSFDDAVNLGVITVIGECTTEFSNIEGTENRNHNIKLAADMLNDSIIEAGGGTWSFNDRAGDTNEAAGFWTAGSIVDGEYVDSVGGGICQVATTIFNSVLEAGLEVIERHNHTLYIASYPAGRDAAIDYPTDLDLAWENGLESDVLLKMNYTDTSLTAQLFSVYTGYTSDYELGDWEEGEKYRTLFEEDDSLGEGSYYRKTVGEDGSKIMVTRYVTDSKGKSVRTDAFESNYEAKDEVYVVGPNVDTSTLVSGGDDA